MGMPKAKCADILKTRKESSQSVIYTILEMQHIKFKKGF